MGTVGSGSTSTIPTQYTCDVSPAYTAEDNETFITKFYLDCVDCPPVVNEDIWNCNLCGNDERYEQPYLSTDEFYLQFRDYQNQYLEFYPFVMDADGNVVDMDWGDGVHKFITLDDFRKFLNVKIKFSEIPVSCFYVKVIFSKIELDPEDYADCIDTKQGEGKSFQQAAHDCILEMTDGNNDVYRGDLYRLTNEECEDTILMESDYDGRYDCYGHYHGANESDERYILRFRFPGTIEASDFGWNTTKVFDTIRKNQVLESYLLRSVKLPPTVAGLIGNAFGGKHFYINGTEYFDPSVVQKNNDDGRMWIINVTVHRKCSEVDFGCVT